MFRRFGYQAQGPELEGWGQGWTPPWAQHEHGHSHGPRGPFQAHMRRGPFGGPFGRGAQGEGGRFFGRGDVKFALLQLLKERPMYGYEMIKALEERSGGFYTPSPGSIYPTLQMLEERGFVSSADAEGKKVYSISESGQALLAEHSGTRDEFAGPPWMRQRRGGSRPELQALRGEGMEVARLFAIAGRVAFEDPEKLSRLRAVIASTRKELSEIIYGESSPATEEPGNPAD
ncbi:MAG TPA: PadR family transcriptional regulator [Ktedonobacteraceae bacterium]